MNAEIQRAQEATRAAQIAARRLLNEEPGPTLRALLIAKVISEISEVTDALSLIQRVAKGGEE